MSKADTTKTFHRIARRKGGAMLFVLCMIFMASAIVLTIVDYASVELRDRASSHIEPELRMIAHSALSASVAVLEEYRTIDGGLYSPAQGWGAPLADSRINFEGADVDVKITDESGKIALSKMNGEAMKRVLEFLGFTTKDAEQMRDCLLDWTDSNTAKSFYGAERDDYDTYAAKPPNRALLSFDELRHIEKIREMFFDENGIPNDYYKRFSEIFTIDCDALVNLNSASNLVLEALLEIEEKDFDKNLPLAIKGEIGSVSDGITWVKSLSEISSRGASDVPSSKYASCKVGLLKIEIWVRRGIAEYYLCAYYGTEDSTKNNARASSNARTTRGTQNTKSSANKSATGKTKTAAQESKSARSAAANFKVLRLVERGK